MLTSSFHLLSEPGIRDRWATLAASSLFRTPFSSLRYLDALTKVTGRQLWIGFVTMGRDKTAEANGAAGTAHVTVADNAAGKDKYALTDIAAIALPGRQFGNWKKADSGPLTPFSCLLARSFPTEEEVHSGSGWDTCLARDLKDQFKSIILPLPVPFQDVRAFQWNGWKVAPRYTFRLDIVPDVNATASWSESTRRNFRKHAAGYRLDETGASARRITALWHQSYSRHARQTPVTLDEATTLIKSLNQSDVRLFSLTKKDEHEPCAGLVLLIEGNEAYYWLAGAEPGPSMTVLIGKVISVLGRDGYSVLDFVGANTPSIAEFKRRFNPTLVPYFVATHSGSLLLRIASRLNQVRRRVFR